MTSDSRILPRRLEKIICLECGLIRDGAEFDQSDLADHYGKNYQLNTTDSGEEHLFFTQNGPVPRSKSIHDWILQIKPKVAGKVLEVGCGQGSLLQRLSASFPNVQFSGIDLNEDAVLRAQRKNLDVSVGASADIVGKFDLIIAFGVLEHVPSPTTFLTDLRKALVDGGELIIGQPMQDVVSYDLFFVDHLHHFTTIHVRFLGQKVGLAEVSVLAGCPLVQNFSLHLFRKGVPEKLSTEFIDPPSLRSIHDYLEAFKRVNDFLRQSRDIAVFGIGEVFTLLYAYTDLARANIVCGLEDNPDRRAHNPWPFPVLRPEEAVSLSGTDVLLSLHPRYNNLVSERLRALGLNAVAILQ